MGVILAVAAVAVVIFVLFSVLGGGSEGAKPSRDVARPTASTVDTSSRVRDLEYALQRAEAQRQADIEKAAAETRRAQAEAERARQQLEDERKRAQDMLSEVRTRAAPGNEKWREDVAFHAFTQKLGKHTERIAQGQAARTIARNSIDALDGGNPTLFTLWRVCQYEKYSLSDLIRRAERE